MDGVEVRHRAGTIKVNKGTPLPLSNHSSIATTDKILSLIVRNPTKNKGLIFIGVSGMSDLDAFSIPVGAQLPALNFRIIPVLGGGHADPTKIFFDVEKSNDSVEFLAILDRES